MKRALPALLLVALAAPSRADEPSEGALREIQENLARERRSAADLGAKEATLLGQLAAVERLVEVEGRSLRAAEYRLKQMTRRLGRAEERLQSAQGELDARTKALGPRL